MNKQVCQTISSGGSLWLARRVLSWTVLFTCVGGIGRAGAEHLIPGTPVYALDISDGTGPITSAIVNCWYSQGVRQVIVKTNAGLVDNPHFVNQVTTVARKSGMGLSVYVYLTFEREGSVSDQIVRAMNRLKYELPGDVRAKVQRLWLDYENETTLPPDWNYDYIFSKIQAGVNTLSYFPMGIYTGEGWWETYTGNSPYFGEFPLWYANWDGVRSLETWHQGQSFGGWPEPAGKQYQGEIRLSCSNNQVDKDYIHVGNFSGISNTTLVSPTSYTTVLTNEQNRITLRWNDIDGDSRWRVEVDRFRDGDYWFEGHQTIGVRDTTSSNWVAPYPDTQYRWRVIGLNNYGGGWSGWGVFNYGYPAVPARPGALDPSGGESVRTARVTLIAGATGEDYRFQIQHDNNRDGVWTQWRTVVLDNAVYPNPNLYVFTPPYNGVPYRWRVQAKNSSGWSRWSGWAYFLFLGS